MIHSARYQLARRILTRLKDGGLVFLIADECHHYTSEESRKIFKFVPYVEKVSGRYCSLGLSAILEDKDLVEMLEPALGRLAKSYLYLSWQRKRLVCMARNHLFCTCELLRDLDLRKGVLIFSESIEQAETLYGMLKDDYGNRIGKYHSKAGKQANENALERFRNREISILITCRALDEGIDVPDAGIGIILSGAGMERQRMQRLGRILRKGRAKEMACLYYLFVKESAEERSYFPLRREYFRIENWEYREQMIKKL